MFITNYTKRSKPKSSKTAEYISTKLDMIEWITKAIVMFIMLSIVIYHIPLEILLNPSSWIISTVLLFVVGFIALFSFVASAVKCYKKFKLLKNK